MRGVMPAPSPRGRPGPYDRGPFPGKKDPATLAKDNFREGGREGRWTWRAGVRKKGGIISRIPRIPRKRCPGVV